MRISPLLHSLLLASWALSNQELSAGLPDYKSRKIESKSGRYVLVLLTPKSERGRLSDLVKDFDYASIDHAEAEKPKWVRERIEAFKIEQDIEREYSVSGLYANDGSKEPLWNIPYISLCQDVHVADDGVHMVVMYSPWDSTCSGTRQLSFYKSGSKVHSYVSEFDFLPYVSMRHFMWLFGMEPPVDETSYIAHDSNEFIVHTNQRDRLAFDLATGALNRCSSPWLYFLVLPLVAVPASLWIMLKRWPCLLTPSERVHRRRSNFSLGTLLVLVAYASFSLAAVKRYGWVGGAFVLIVTVGALAAGYRNRSVWACAVGSVLALYGAYVGALCYAAIETQLHHRFGLGPLWWRGGWWLCIPSAMVLLLAVGGALVGRQFFSEESVSRRHYASQQ